MKKKALCMAVSLALTLGLCPGLALAADGDALTNAGIQPQAITTQATDIANAEMDGMYVWWNGKADYKPNLVIKLGKKTLTKGTDYTIASYSYFGPTFEKMQTSGTQVKGVSKKGLYTAEIKGKGSYSGSRTVLFIAGKATVSVGNQKYTGKALKPEPTVKFNWDGDTVRLHSAAYYKAMLEPGMAMEDEPEIKVAYSNNTKVGSTAKVTITGIGDYAGNKVTTTFKVVKGDNPMKVKVASKAIAASKVKSASQTVEALSFTKKAAGTVTYKNVSTAKVSKYFSVNAKNGKITAKKGTPKGTYAVKTQVSAAGNSNYKSAVKTYTATIKVK